MGYERALRAIHLQETDRIPNWELISNPEFERTVTGIDPYVHPQKCALKLIEKLDLDVTAGLPLSDDPLKNRITVWKEESAKYDEEGNLVVRWGAGTTWRWNWGEGFKSVEEVLDFDPSKIKYDTYTGDLTLSVEEMARAYNRTHLKMQRLAGSRSLVMGCYYKTLFMWPLMTFGWNLFMRTVLEEPKEFRKLLDRFALISQKVYEAWGMTDVKLMNCHDDLCTANGPVFSPKWYRRYAYPWYKKLWEPLKRKGIKIVFVSDGNTDLIADDIFEAGADGMFLERYSSLERMAEKYGDEKFFMGNIDTNILTHGSKEDIWREVERCTRTAKDCPGYFYCASGHIPHNVPVENAMTYFEACRKLGQRS